MAPRQLKAIEAPCAKYFLKMIKHIPYHSYPLFTDIHNLLFEQKSALKCIVLCSFNKNKYFSEFYVYGKKILSSACNFFLLQLPTFRELMNFKLHFPGIFHSTNIVSFKYQQHKNVFIAKSIQIYDSHNVHEYDAALLEHRSAFVGAVLRE